MKEPIHLARWESLSQENRDQVLKLSLTEQQIEYAGTIERSIERCRADVTGDLQGAAIIRANIVVGFLELKCGLAAPVWASTSTVVLSALRVDRRFQGQGIGTVALQLLPTFVMNRWPSANNIMLAVDEENRVARRSYEKAGWSDTGAREIGRIGWVRYMERAPLADNHLLPSSDSTKK